MNNKEQSIEKAKREILENDYLYFQTRVQIVVSRIAELSEQLREEKRKLVEMKEYVAPTIDLD